MKHKTATTLGELRIGDTFVYNLKQHDVWYVTACADKKGKVAINQMVNKQLLHKHDQLRKAKMPVVFLRHTIPVEGEECFLEDLGTGDVFAMIDDVVHEYEVIQPGHDFWKIRRLDRSAVDGYGGRLAKVIFVRHKD